MNQTNSSYDKKFRCIGIVFGMAFLILIHNLTKASLWFDETIEYYYSKYMFGLVPGGGESVNMYQRIISTFQPPLYNFLMFFWLKFKDTEWWFRFFGVVMGMIGSVGVYKTVEREINWQAGCIVAMVLVTTRQYVYYSQECAEYCILLAALPWMVYTWINVMKEFSVKRFFLFIITVVAAIYSQYGALFPAAAFTVTACISVLMSKNKKNIIQAAVTGAVSFIIIVLPLWVFFFQKQMQNQQRAVEHIYSADDTFFVEMGHCFSDVFRWNFNLDAGWSHLTLVVFAVVIVFTRKKVIRSIGISNIICWLSYYLAVKFNFYSYGSFGSRYNLFFMPVWIITIAIYIGELKNILFERMSNDNKKLIISGVITAFSLCMVINGWDSVKNNWTKEDIRGAAAKWYEVKAYDRNTLVYYAAESGFSFYLREYDDSIMTNVTTMKFYRDRTVEEYREYIRELYGGILPDELYFIASHSSGDLNTILQFFSEEGYEAADIYNSGGGRLVYLSLKI